MVEESPNGMDLDDVSTSTPTAANQEPVKYEGEEKDYVVKFAFRPEDDENAEIANTHYKTLQIIMKVFPEVEIYNNYGQSKKAFRKLLSHNDYHRNFKLHFSKGNRKKSRSPMYVALAEFSPTTRWWWNLQLID